MGNIASSLLSLILTIYLFKSILKNEENSKRMNIIKIMIFFSFIICSTDIMYLIVKDNNCDIFCFYLNTIFYIATIYCLSFLCLYTLSLSPTIYDKSDIY